MALGGPQEQHRVDLGDVEAFVEQIHREQNLQLAVAQAADLLGALVAGAGGIEGGGAQAGGHELAGHPVGVLHAHAEAQGPHRLQVGDLVGQFAQDQAQAGVVGGVEVGEGLGGVAVAAPFDPRQVGAVVEAEVVEGAQEALVEGAPEAQFGGGAALEPMEDVLAAGALGGGGEAQQQDGLQVGQPALVAGGGGVVELIDDHHGEGVRRQVCRIQPSERLHRGEHMAPLAGALAIHQQLAEGAIAQHLAEGGEALLQDLAPVGHEQQARVTRTGQGSALDGELRSIAAILAGCFRTMPCSRINRFSTTWLSA